MSIIYNKVCKNCKQKFQSTARNSRYCCEECGEKYRARLADERTVYSQSKDVERLRARSHALAVKVMDELVALGVIVKKCAHCGATKRLHVHHINNFNWLNNTPSNLMYLCESCHNKEHSRVTDELKSKGKTLDDFYDKSLKPFYDIIDNARK